MYEHYEENKLKKWLIGGAVLTVFALIIGYFSWKYLDQEKPNSQHLSASKDCLVDRETCTAMDNQGRSVHLSFSPHPVPTMQPIEVTAEVEGIKANKPLKVVISGLNMYMGFQRTVLKPVAPNKFKGTLTLPVCTEDVMNWQARILLPESETSVWTAEFLFNTYKSK